MAAVPVSLIVFDVLWEGAKDLRAQPLRWRRQRLERVIPSRPSPVIRLSRFVQADGQTLMKEAHQHINGTTLELFAGRVGPKPSDDRLVLLRKEGEERYAKKIPPGFEDAKKGVGDIDKFGDLIIWKEMIDKAKAEKRPLIFVTDDGKSDWWYIHHGKKVGPHPDLVEEFLASTGQQFHIYELLQFLRYSAESGSSIQPETVQQIADTMIADFEIASTQTAAAERTQVIKALRTEIRGKEFELDGLIKSLIDFPPKTTEAVTAPGDDAKRALKARIGELTDLVNVLRQRLSSLETDT